MASVPEDSNFLQRKALESQKKFLFPQYLHWETEAIKVIKEKIRHYHETGNLKKLAIYQSKLEGKRRISGILEKLKEFYK